MLTTINELLDSLDLQDAGDQMYRLIAELYPICRSITGDGFRETLNVLGEYIPLRVHEVATGTRVFDWTVPKEWNIRDAYIKNSRGERIVDFRRSNLHVVSYSAPVRRRMGLDELRPHLHTLPEYTEWVPYRTTYYKEDWGFCLSHRQLLEMDDDDYEVCIDSSLKDGHLTYGELLIEGKSPEEVLISAHACHPSLCDDNLSGVAVATYLAKYLRYTPLRYSYRFLFIPGTVGSITWLSRNESLLPRIRHGVVLTCVGDESDFTYKRSRRGDALVDRAFEHVLKHSDQEPTVIDFFPYGYDERQYCSPAFNLPVGSLMRMRHGQMPQYHTSADDLDFVQAEQLAGAVETCLAAFSILENDRNYLNQSPKCEPQLGKRGLYAAVGGHSHTRQSEMAMLWVLNMSDGEHSLLEIAERAGMPFQAVSSAADALRNSGLLKEAPEGVGSKRFQRSSRRIEVHA
jgi:aminopeptidase-like protein